MLGSWATATILGVEMHAAQSRVGKGLVELGHVSANGGRTFDQLYLVSGFSDIQRGLDAGNARAHHQNIRVDFFDTGKEFVMVVDAADSRGHQMHGLARGFFGVGHNPGAVFADAGHLKQERVEPRTQACILKSFFMQSWRTGRHKRRGSVRIHGCL